jgi:hypothetical protein
LQKFRLHELWLQKPCGPEFKEVWGKFQNLFRVRIGNAIVYCKKNFDMNIQFCTSPGGSKLKYAMIGSGSINLLHQVSLQLFLFTYFVFI